MKIEKAENVRAILDEIKHRLDSLEELTLWLMKANLRFKKRQRVKVSAVARRRNVTLVRGPQKGTVIEVSNGFTIKVLPDGYKKPHDYWHGYWEPVGKK